MHLREDAPVVNEKDGVTDGIVIWYSSLSDTMYTLLASITGGVDWTDAVAPLDRISTIYRCLWTFYIIFVVIGVMNVLTGIFVERACELSGLDKDLVVQAEVKRNELFVKEMKKLFREADADGSGSISWHEFKEYLENPQVQAYLCTKQLNAFDARSFFDVLRDEQEELDIEAFIVGCQRLKGQARSVDLLAVLKECQKNRRDIKALIRRLDNVVPSKVPSEIESPKLPFANSNKMMRAGSISSCSSGLR